uniref:Uncharacterized protein n=1 Tax=Anguilla anguilla TaxID=7936 RepID=A0A0E9V7N6_ANGAN
MLYNRIQWYCLIVWPSCRDSCSSPCMYQ